FNVYSDRKVTEKLRYMHRNRVRRELISSPELWRWSSYRAFAFGEQAIVKLNWQAERKNRKAKSNRGTGGSDILAAHSSKLAKDGVRAGCPGLSRFGSCIGLPDKGCPILARCSRGWDYVEVCDTSV